MQRQVGHNLAAETEFRRAFRQAFEQADDAFHRFELMILMRVELELESFKHGSRCLGLSKKECVEVNEKIAYICSYSSLLQRCSEQLK